MYKMQYKPDNPSFHITLFKRNYNSWIKNAKNGKNGQFSLILTYVTPWKGVFKGYRIIENVENAIKMFLTNHLLIKLSKNNQISCIKL